MSARKPALLIDCPDELDELFEQAIYDAAKALEEEDHDEVTHDSDEVNKTYFVELVESFDPDYTPAPNNLDPEQCRYGVDFDAIWIGISDDG